VFLGGKQAQLLSYFCVCLFVYFSSSGANLGSEGGGEEEEKAHKLCCFWVSG
jgi:hypothetical protein